MSEARYTYRSEQPSEAPFCGRCDASGGDEGLTFPMSAQLAASVNSFLAASAVALKLVPVYAPQLGAGSSSGIQISLYVLICSNQSKVGTVMAGRSTRLCLATTCFKHVMLASERGTLGHGGQPMVHGTCTGCYHRLCDGLKGPAMESWTAPADSLMLEQAEKAWHELFEPLQGGAPCSLLELLGVGVTSSLESLGSSFGGPPATLLQRLREAHGQPAQVAPPTAVALEKEAEKESQTQSSQERGRSRSKKRSKEQKNEERKRDRRKEDKDARRTKAPGEKTREKKDKARTTKRGKPALPLAPSPGGAASSSKKPSKEPKAGPETLRVEAPPIKERDLLQMTVRQVFFKSTQKLAGLQCPLCARKPWTHTVGEGKLELPSQHVSSLLSHLASTHSGGEPEEQFGITEADIDRRRARATLSWIQMGAALSRPCRTAKLEDCLRGATPPQRRSSLSRTS